MIQKNKNKKKFINFHLISNDRNFFFETNANNFGSNYFCLNNYFALKVFDANSKEKPFFK